MTGAEAVRGVDIPSDLDERRLRERALVQRAQGGDMVAFEQLYRENHRRVYALCYRMAGAERADELTQDVFVRAWQKIGSFRGESAFSSWLHPLTVNVVYSDLRVRRRYTDRVTTTDDLTPYEPAQPRAERGADAVDLERALQRLPPGARRVFVLHDVEGYRHAEIARMTGTAVGTSKAQLHRARRLLREVLSS